MEEHVMLTKTKSYCSIFFCLIVLLIFYSCVKIGNETTAVNEGQFLDETSSTGELAMSQSKSDKALEYLGNFETLVSLGFTPDDVTYSPQHGGTLFISAVGDDGTQQRVFKVSTEGELIQSFYILPGLGYSIARVDNGPNNGHFFLIKYTGLPETQVYEYDDNFNLLNQFAMVGSQNLGDDLAYNSKTKSFLSVDGAWETGGFAVEFSTEGEVLSRFPAPIITGLTFNDKTGTYFGVTLNRMIEFSTSGITIKTYDLTPFGISGAVGVAYGNKKFYIADEGRDSEVNTIGIIHILKLME